MAEENSTPNNKLDPAVVFFPFILIASTAIAIAIPFFYSSASRPELVSLASNEEEKITIVTIEGTEEADLYSKEEPLRFNTRDMDPFFKQFGVKLEIRKLTETKDETWKMVQSNETWKIVQVKIKEICFLFLSNQYNNDLQHVDNHARYEEQILRQINNKIFSNPKYAEFNDFVIGIKIRNLYKYTRPGTEE